MAEPVCVADFALKKLADQLECSICLDSFINPKLLQCFHVFCKDCLEPLVVRDQHGLSLCCPKCRRSTLLPVNGVSGLQPAFHVHHLFEIQDALQKVKQGQEGQKTLCEKCNKREANGFCRDCGDFVCDECIAVHQAWKEYSTHTVISLEQLKSDATDMVPPTKKILYCSKHPEKELDLFCETDQELICQHCIVKTHRDHQYDLVSETFPKHREAIFSHLDPIKLQLSTLDRAIQDIDRAQSHILDQQASIEADILAKIGQLHEALEMRKIELIGQLGKMTQPKLKTLSIQRNELELIQTQLNSCIEFVNDSLKIGSEAEILAMEKPVVQKVKEMYVELGPINLPPNQEQADLAFKSSIELLPACQQFGQVSISQVSPDKWYATGQGLEAATVGELSTVTMHTISKRGRKRAKSLPLTSISCELVSCNLAEWVKCKVKSTKGNLYNIEYQSTCKGRHQLHIKVCDQHIRGSPFTVVAMRKLEAPTSIISGLNFPAGVVVNDMALIVAEFSGYCVSIYSPSGEKIKSFGERGSAPGQFLSPQGVTVDRAGNILVVDGGNHHIQKFTSDGNFIASAGCKGDKPCQFNLPIGISISPNDKVYICDRNNHRIQILSSDLTFLASLGVEGGGDGQLKYPWDVAFNSRGNVYIADSGNHRIQVFTEDSNFVRKFGKKGRGDGELSSPVSVAIDSDDAVYVADYGNHRISHFTSKGYFLRSFGMQGEGPGQFKHPYGVTVDEDGLVYISDRNNMRIQIW